MSRRAKVLFSGAGFSKSTWGWQTSGLPYREWVKLEVAAANAGGFGQGRCRYSALCIACGPNGHPFVRAIRELFVLWFKLILPIIKTKDPFLEELATAWQIIKNHVNPLKQVLTFDKALIKVQGVLSQVIVFLYCLGWNRQQFDCWASPGEVYWKINADE